MSNNTAKELLELARHYEQFNINHKDIDLLNKAAKELEDLENDIEVYQEFVNTAYDVAHKTTITQLDNAIKELESKGL